MNDTSNLLADGEMPQASVLHGCRRWDISGDPLTLCKVFRLALRQTEGLIGSVVELLRFDRPVPDRSTLGRRSRTLRMPAAAGPAT